MRKSSAGRAKRSLRRKPQRFRGESSEGAFDQRIFRDRGKVEREILRRMPGYFGRLARVFSISVREVSCGRVSGALVCNPFQMVCA